MTVAPLLAAAHLSRWSLNTRDGRHLWVDAPPTWVPTEELGNLSADRTPSGAHLRPRPPVDWVLTAPVIHSGGAAVHEVPWPPELLASLLLASGEQSDRAGRQVALAGRILGEFARRLHAGRIDVHGSRGDDCPGPTWVDRLADPPASSLAARPHWQGLRTRLLEEGERERTTLHGELRSDHVLVPSLSGGPSGSGRTGKTGRTGRTGGTGARLVVLGRPEGPATADPAADLGSLLGDLVEVTLLGSRLATGCSEAVVAAYESSGAVDPALWTRVAGYAALKVVDHELRLASSRGVETSPQTADRLDLLARRVGDGVALLVRTPRRPS